MATGHSYTQARQKVQAHNVSGRTTVPTNSRSGPPGAAAPLVPGWPLPSCD